MIIVTTPPMAFIDTASRSRRLRRRQSRLVLTERQCTTHRRWYCWRLLPPPPIPWKPFISPSLPSCRRHTCPTSHLHTHHRLFFVAVVVQEAVSWAQEEVSSMTVWGCYHLHGMVMVTVGSRNCCRWHENRSDNRHCRWIRMMGWFLVHKWGVLSMMMC